MKWKRVCIPCYNASVPRRGQSKKIVFLQNADKEINSTMRKILSTDSNVSYFHSAYKGEVGFTALATLLPTPPPQKKPERKGCSLSEPDRSKITQLGWQIASKVLDIFIAFVYRLFHVVVKGLGIDRVIQLFEINLFTPELPKTPCEESSNFYVLCTTSDVISVTVNLAFSCSGVNGLR